MRELGAQRDFCRLEPFLKVALMALGLFAIQYSHTTAPTTFPLVFNYLPFTAHASGSLCDLVVGQTPSN